MNLKPDLHHQQIYTIMEIIDRQTEDGWGVLCSGLFALSRPEPGERQVQMSVAQSFVQHKELKCSSPIHDLHV